MKIIAVSDIPSPRLESIVEKNPGKLRDIDVLLSCGDLDREYLEFLAEGLSKDLFFVVGNHPNESSLQRYLDEAAVEKMGDNARLFRKNDGCHIAGSEDLHGRVQAYRDFLIVGFGGSLWYNGRQNQYTEGDMARIVKSAERKILLCRLQEKLLRLPERDIIVISHAPVFQVHDQPDICHTGFKCFREFIDRTAPLLWIHGHIHLPDMSRNQVSLVGKTTVVNAYGCKYLEIGRHKVEVLSQCI